MLLRQRVREYAYANGYGIDQAAEQTVLDGEAGVLPGSLQCGKLLAVQMAKNAATDPQDTEAVKNDYTYCVDRLGRYADILVVNVSSPNTIGLRSLQQTEPLTSILSAVVQAARITPRKTKPAVMVKVSPDEDSFSDIHGICSAIIESGVDGLIISNTTSTRPIAQSHLTPSELTTLNETGGYSGPGMFAHTKRLVARYRYLLDDMCRAEDNTAEVERPKTIFASGGITNGRQVLEVLEAGASVAMVYTALVYGGAGKITSMKGELREEMKKRIAEAEAETENDGTGREGERGEGDASVEVLAPAGMAAQLE